MKHRRACCIPKVAAPIGEHVVEHALSLAATVAGGSLSCVDAPFPIDSAREAWAERLRASNGNKPLAILNPGAGWGAKRWPAEAYGIVAAGLSKRGMTVLINHGPGEEPLAESVSAASGRAAIPVKCSVGELIALTRRASLFVGGDTGPMHLAAAFARARGGALRSHSPGAQWTIRNPQRRPP